MNRFSQVHMTHILDKTSMDELKFLKMFANNDALRSSQIGTYLHYVVLDAIKQERSREYSQSMVSRVTSLLSIQEKDFLLITKLYGLNDVKNLEFLESHELSNDFYNLSRVNECYIRLTKSSNESVSQELEKKKSKSRYMFPSPCLENYPECKAFCEWHQTMAGSITTSEIDAFER